MILISLILIIFSISAQTPMGINYQSVIRDVTGNVLNNTTIKLKISIISGSTIGTVEYSETHLPTTNNFGLISLVIGSGSIISGTLNSIDWGINNFYVKIEVDPEGGDNFQLSGTTQLMSVPYAMHAKTTEIDLIDDADPDPDPANEIQTLTFTGSKLSISNGNAVTLPSSDDADANPTNEIQLLGITGKTLNISSGNSVSLPIPNPSPWASSDANIVFSEGNVGIGTDDPLVALSVGGIGDASTGIYSKGIGLCY